MESLQDKKRLKSKLSPAFTLRFDYVHHVEGKKWTKRILYKGGKIKQHCKLSTSFSVAMDTLKESVLFINMLSCLVKFERKKCVYILWIIQTFYPSYVFSMSEMHFRILFVIYCYFLKYVKCLPDMLIPVIFLFDFSLVLFCIHSCYHNLPSFRYTGVASCAEVSQLSQVYWGAAEVCGGRQLQVRKKQNFTTQVLIWWQEPFTARKVFNTVSNFIACCQSLINHLCSPPKNHHHTVFQGVNSSWMD